MRIQQPGHLLYDINFFKSNDVKLEELDMGLHVVLYQPEIPGNTGNIARTCVGTNTTLHLIHPLGFDISNKMLRRAGLDYWKHLRVKEYQSIDELFATYPHEKFFFIEDHGTRFFTEVDYYSYEGDLFFVFGRETSGLPVELIKKKKGACLKIPMTSKVRSLNLANTVAIVLYEALKQRGFPCMK